MTRSCAASRPKGSRISNCRAGFVFWMRFRKVPPASRREMALAAQFKAEMDAVPEASAAFTEVESRSSPESGEGFSKSTASAQREDFFQLGGDSLALTLMLAEVDIEFGPDDRAEFLSSPNVETLARIVMRSPARRSEPSPFVALQPNGVTAFRFSAFPARTVRCSVTNS